MTDPGFQEDGAEPIGRGGAAEVRCDKFSENLCVKMKESGCLGAGTAKDTIRTNEIKMKIKTYLVLQHTGSLEGFHR